MQRSYNLYNNLGYWFLPFIALVIIGFYPTYFGIIFRPMPSIIHVHFTFMIMWVMMVITQPFLIKYKKFTWHRRIGKLSYLIVPLAIITGFAMMRYAYYNQITFLRLQVMQGKLSLNESDIVKQAGVYIEITVLYLTWFILFYTLAIMNKRHTPSHARYMLASALLLLGPTVDRIVYNTQIAYAPDHPFRYELLSFFIQDIVIAALMIKDIKSKKRTKALRTCLIIFLAGQILYFTVEQTEVYSKIAMFLMKPAP